MCRSAFHFYKTLIEKYVFLFLAEIQKRATKARFCFIGGEGGIVSGPSLTPRPSGAVASSGDQICFPANLSNLLFESRVRTHLYNYP
jgi:hypothetical protein